LFDPIRHRAGSAPTGRIGRPVAVGLVTTGRETWVVFSARAVDPAEIDRPVLAASDRTMRICREVLADGRVRIGAVDAPRARLLAGYLGEP
jgi:hypothetical protein